MQLDKLGDTIDEVLAKTGTRKLTASQRIVILGCVGGFIPAQPAGVSEVVAARSIFAEECEKDGFIATAEALMGGCTMAGIHAVALRAIARAAVKP